MDREKYYVNAYARDIFYSAQRYQDFLDVIKEFPHHRMLDVGCGDGSFSSVVKKTLKIKEVYGVDISGVAIKLANSNGIKGISMDFDKKRLPFKNDYFDVVFCGEIIEHIVEIDRFLMELRRVMKPNGVILFTTPNLASWYNRLSLLMGYQPMYTDISFKYSCGHLWNMDSCAHLRVFTLKGLKGLLEAHRFKIVKSRGIGVNDRVGYGKKFPLITKVINFVFNNAAWNSFLFITAVKEN
jgi:methionine biosynthesis protein MetW